jgi:hypothetical protein
MPLKLDIIGPLISLVHSFSKLFSKLLAMRLRPCMNGLIGATEYTFVKGRNLHDNFILVRQVARKKTSKKSERSSPKA